MKKTKKTTKETPSPKATRKPDEIRAEYTVLCAQLGEVTYHLECILPDQRNTLIKHIQALDVEMKNAIAEAQMLDAARGADDAIASVTSQTGEDDQS